MRHVLLPTNYCPAPLDSEPRCKFQFVALFDRCALPQNTTSSRTSAHAGVAIPYGGAAQQDVVK